MFGTTLGVRLTGLAESLASSLQGCFVDLSVALGEAYRSSSAVDKGSDMLDALDQSYHDGTTREGFNEHHRLVSSHPKAVGKCFVVKCLTSLLVDA